MAAKIGILGESTLVTVDTNTTIYTVPSSKAARVRVMHVEQAGGDNHNINWTIGSPGIEITISSRGAGAVDTWTGYGNIATPDPVLGRQWEQWGLQALNSGIPDLDAVDNAVSWVITPLPVDYYLSTGDVVVIQVRNSAPQDFLSQVHGVEDDA